MNTTAFDTLAAARELQRAGADQRLAEAIASTVNSAQGNHVSGEQFHAGLDALQAELRADLYRALWIQSGVIVAAIGVLLALFQFVAA